MKHKEIIWSQTEYSGYIAKIGRIRVGAVSYNGIDRDDSLRYIASCPLPGLKNNILGKYPTQEEAKARVLKAINNWMEEISEEIQP